MSNYKGLARHPKTDTLEVAEWLDDYFARHVYGVRFSDGNIYSAYAVTHPSEVQLFRLAQRLANELEQVLDGDTPDFTVLTEWDEFVKGSGE